MTNIGIIAEFNPYHNGHAYLIREARRLVNAAADASDSGADAAGAGVVVLMSGNFVQRGSAAVFDKYTRARAALTDADIIFELPTLWAASDAGHFAGCGVIVRKWDFHSEAAALMVMMPVSLSCTLLPWNSWSAMAMAAYTSLFIICDF